MAPERTTKMPGPGKVEASGAPVDSTQGEPPRRRTTRKKNRGVTKDKTLRERAVIAMFRHRGEPSFRAFGAVAEDLDIPVQQVTPLLHAAFSDKMFSVNLNLEAERVEIADLEQAVRRRYAHKGLRTVTLVHAEPTLLEDLHPDERVRVRLEVTGVMARLLAPHLDALVANAAKEARAAERAGRRMEPFRIGVGSGRTIRLLADHLLHTPRPVRTPAVEIVPTLAVVGTLGGNHLEANMIAQDIAEAFGGLSDQIPCVALPRAEEAAIVTQPHRVREGLQKCMKCHVVITGIGAVGAVPDNGSDLPLSKDPAENAKVVEAVRRDGGCGQIGYAVFDTDGRRVPTAYKTIGLTPEDLHRMVRDGREVILIAGGDRRRFLPIKVALSAGLVTWLLSDTITAKFLVDEL
ncbi:MAG: hypothetical protein E6J69_09275 [Deltaproteobacteria bacterium]|nr:MAG: hypothetical protein E6J69_09275 [Deltaproteobacteria bacterium]